MDYAEQLERQATDGCAGHLGWLLSAENDDIDDTLLDTINDEQND